MLWVKCEKKYIRTNNGGDKSQRDAITLDIGERKKKNTTGTSAVVLNHWAVEGGADTTASFDFVPSTDLEQFASEIACKHLLSGAILKISPIGIRALNYPHV